MPPNALASDELSSYRLQWW